MIELVGSGHTSENKLVILERDMNDTLEVLKKMHMVRKIPHKCIITYTHRDYLVICIWLCSFSFSNWSNIPQPCPVHRPGQMRRQLGVVRCFVVISRFARVERGDDITTSSPEYGTPAC